MNIITVGIDLAKNVFAVHGVNDSGKPVLVKPKVSRADLLLLVAQLPPCTIGMEACSGTHHQSRGRLYPQLAGAGCTSGARQSWRETGSLQSLGKKPG